MGRANFLFVGNEASGHHHAVLYTLINSCQQHGHNPVDYLTDVLTRIDDYPARDIIELLPHRWRPPDASAHVTRPEPRNAAVPRRRRRCSDSYVDALAWVVTELRSERRQDRPSTRDDIGSK